MAYLRFVFHQLIDHVHSFPGALAGRQGYLSIRDACVINVKSKEGRSFPDDHYREDFHLLYRRYYLEGRQSKYVPFVGSATDGFAGV